MSDAGSEEQVTFEPGYDPAEDEEEFEYGGGVEDAEQSFAEMVAGQGDDGNAGGWMGTDGVTIVRPEDRIMVDRMTKFERARILGARATQIENMAPLHVSRGGLTDPLEIARKELNARKIPFTLRRYLTPTLAEEWSSAELIQDERSYIPNRDDEIDAAAGSAPRTAHDPGTEVAVPPAEPIYLNILPA